jgi:hypothetical protein
MNMTSEKIAPPTIQITPLTIRKTSTNPHRIVSGAFNLNPSNPACISNDSGDIISYIRKNGDSKKAIIERMDGTRIASFNLPISPGDGFKDDEGPILCWASFQRRLGRQTHQESDGERKMLCMLSNPTTLHIFDVLGDFNLNKQQGSSIGPSGHTIPLPFRARALFSVDYFGTDNCHGLLILRAPSDREPVPAEVPFSPEGLSIPGTPRRYPGNDVEDELQLPPEPVRLNFQRDEFIDMEEDEAVPSLFSLCHPLDEIRPIAKNTSNKNDNANLFANVDERLMFVGSPRLFARHESHSAESAQTYVTPICVTYNSILKRHSIWSLTNAVEPIPALPLWRTTGRGAWRTDEKEDAMRESGSIGGSEDTSQADSTDQREEGYPSSLADIYPDFTMNLLLEEEVGASHNPDSWMETKINMKTSKEANHNAFLATDEIGTGDLTLCIVMPNCDGEMSEEPSILRRFLLTAEAPHANNSSPVCVSSVSVLDDILCISAQQIQSVPVPLAHFSSTKKGTRFSSRFHADDANTMSNDVLIVRKSNDKGIGSTKLSLSRSGSIYIGDLVLPSNVINADMMLVKVENTVGSRADINFIDSNCKTVTVRAFISLIVRKSPITEITLRAVESALVSLRSGEALSLMIRSDCNALSQFIQSDSSCAKVEDCCWYSLTVVILNLLLGFEDSAISSEMRQESGSQKSAWEELLQSDFHAAFSQGEGKLLFGDSKLTSLKHSNVKLSPDIGRYIKMLSSTRIDLGPEHMHVIFDSLHILHEDARLVSQSRGGAWTRRLGSLLLHVCEQYSPFMTDYEDHYRRLLGDARCQDALPCNTHTPARISRFELSPCIMTCLDSIIRCGTGDSGAHFEVMGYIGKNIDMNGACFTSWMVLQLFQALFNDNTDADSHLVITMLKEGINQSSQLQDELPISVSYPLMEAIRRCRLNPPHIADLTKSIGALSTNGVSSFYDLLGRTDLSALSTKASCPSVCTDVDFRSNQDDPDKDGLVALEDYSSMVFPEDNRIREAARLLRCSRTLFLRVPRPVEQTDHEYERSKQEKLLLLCRRSIALPLGRGMITLGSYNIQSSEQLFMPNIVLAGRVPPTNGALALGECIHLRYFQVP